MERRGKRASTAVLLAVVVSAVVTVVTDRVWGWDFAVRCAGLAVLYLLTGPLLARSRRRAEARDARHLREIREARRGRR